MKTIKTIICVVIFVIVMIPCILLAIGVYHYLPEKSTNNIYENFTIISTGIFSMFSAKIAFQTLKKFIDWFDSKLK